VCCYDYKGLNLKYPLSKIRKMVEKNILDECYEKAKETLKECSTKNGLYASGGKDGYRGVWARDSMISLIGASSDNDKFIKSQFRKSLVTLAKFQSKNGQIPNAILNFNRKKQKAEFKSIDSTLWFVIGHYVYMKRYGDKSLFNRYQNSIEKSLVWIKYQDFGENVTLEQLPTTDWQDAFPNKYGDTINTQALYAGVLKFTKDRKTLRNLKSEVNKKDDNKLWGGDYYWAYRWKNHNKYKEIGDWFDSLGNTLAIIFGLADKKQSKRILSYMRKKKINLPYPVKCISPPIKKSSEYWEDYYYDAGATPNHYLNGGIWPYIGAFYVLALIKLKKYKLAKKELESVAKSNLDGNLFPEWIDPKTKKSYGKLQAWDAGTYILAYNSLKKRKVLI
jgi:glycogen debranching enzyme